LTASRLLLLILLLSACSTEPGAESTKKLETGLMEALRSGDLPSAQRYFLDGQAYLKACPDRFDKAGKERVLRQVANGKRRFARFFNDCRTKLTGEVTINKRSGGQKRRQVAGCGEGVWEHYDLTMDVDVEGRQRTVKIDGIMGIGGRYYVVERLVCR